MGAKRKAAKKIKQKKNVVKKTSRKGSIISSVVPLGIFIALAFLLYGKSLNFGYILDDKIVVSENKFVQEGLDGIGKIFSKETFTGFLGEQKDLLVGARYRPLSLAMFAFEKDVFGNDPYVFHFINILLYGLTGFVLFLLFKKLIPGNNKMVKLIPLLPLLTALFFIFHPVHTEVVANIKSRDEIITLLLSLWSMLIALNYIEKGKNLSLLSLGLVFFAALLAKENAVTFLAIVPLTLLFFTKATRKQVLTTLLPMGIAFVAYLLIRWNVVGYLMDPGKEITGIMNNPFYGLSTGEKFATIQYTLGRYVQLLFFPHPLTHDYYPYHIPIMHFGNWKVIAWGLFYIGITYFAIKEFRQKSIAAWTILFFLITISIVSNIVFPVGVPMAERLIYMPSVAFCVLLAWALSYQLPKYLKGSMKQYLPLAIAVVILFLYGFKTLDRVPDWQDELTLNTAAVKVSKNSARANSYMGYTLYRRGLQIKDPAQQKAIFDEATPYVDKALEIYPQYTDALTAKSGLLGGYYQQDKNLDKLLQGFYEVLEKQHVPFVDTYLEYLNKRENKEKLVNFYHRAGYELLWKQQGNQELARKYINYGLSLTPGDERLLGDLEAVDGKR